MKQGQSRTGATQRHSTSEKGNPYDLREALAGGARWADREFVCLSRGGNVAVVMGNGPVSHGHGGEEVGTAPVRREEATMLQHRASSQRMARGGGRLRGGTRERTGRKYAAEPLGPQVSWAMGGRAGGSHRIANSNAKGSRRVTARNCISRQTIIA